MSDQSSAPEASEPGWFMRAVNWADGPQAMKVLSRLVLFVLFAAALFVVVRVFTGHVAEPQDRNDLFYQVFGSRSLIAVVRLVVLFIAAFVVMSVIARIWNSEWLTKAGPFEIEKQVASLRGLAREGASDNRAGADEIRVLKDRLAASDDLNERLLARLMEGTSKSASKRGWVKR